jgi:hypothetical protein
MTVEDEWVQVAMTDDSLVVELLLKLNQPEPLPAPRRRRHFPPDLVKEGAVLALSVDWSVRQRRSSSKHVLMTRRKKGSDSSAHASPTTPLSFSCATSVSGGGDGFDEATTSLPSKLFATSRSKVCLAFFLSFFLSDSVSWPRWFPGGILLFLFQWTRLPFENVIFIFLSVTV